MMNELLFMRNVVVERPPTVQGVALIASSSLAHASCQMSRLVILNFLLGVIKHLFAASIHNGRCESLLVQKSSLV
jgi:hypothetical protein